MSKENFVNYNKFTTVKCCLLYMKYWNGSVVKKIDRLEKYQFLN